MAERQYRQFGNYQSTEKIGETPFAKVYRAKGKILYDEVVVKWLNVSLVSQNQRERFEAEARALCQLIDPRYSVQVKDFGYEENRPFLVMKDVSTLVSWRQVMAQEGRQTPENILPSVQRIVAALHYVHEHQVTHGNLKPENVLLGRNEEVLLTDFGLTALLPLRTRVNDQTAAYIAPELKQGKVTRASDQYALGVMIYERLTGALPSQGGGASVRQHVPSLSPKIEEVVRTALDPNPEHRYGSVVAFAKAFENACQPSQPMVPVARTRSTPDPALAGAGQKMPKQEMSPAVSEKPAASKKQQPAGQQTALPGGTERAAPKPFQLWVPYGPEPPSDESERSVAFKDGVSKIGALPAAVISGKKSSIWVAALIAVVVIVLVGGGLLVYSGVSGPGSHAVVATKTLARQPTATHAAAPTVAPTLKQASSGAISVAPNQQQAGTASCPNDAQLVGGGYSIAPSGPLTADASYPVDLHTWKAILTNGTPQPVQLTVYAECLSAAPSLGIKLVTSAATSVAAGSTTPVLANCAAGIAVGGGFLTDPAVNGVVVSSQPITSQNGWSISTKAGKSSLTETAYALCATTHVSNPTLSMQNVAISPGSANPGAIKCDDSAQLLTSSGFSSGSAADDDGYLFFSGSAPGTDAASWQVTVYNNDTTKKHTAQLTGVCVSLTRA